MKTNFFLVSSRWSRKTVPQHFGWCEQPNCIPEQRLSEKTKSSSSHLQNVRNLKRCTIFLHFLIAQIIFLVAGESVRYLGRWENGILAISNYRLFIQHSTKMSEVSIPVRLIENVQIKDMFQLIISCKDAVTYSCTFATSEVCLEWHTRISLSTCVPEQLEQLFAFSFHAWVSESAASLDQAW